MKALVLDGADRFRYEERPRPGCPADHVLVRVDAVCICGSDIHAIRGDQPLFSFPRVIGHEVAGTVEEVGEQAQGFAPGDRVCLMPCIPCGTCRACRAGRTNACKKLRLYGVHEDGGLQEYLAAPAENWLKVPADAPAEEISMLEPLTIGAHGVAKLALRPGERVLIIGAGPIGVSCAVNARTYGAEAVLADTSPVRRKMVRERFGLEVLDPLRPDYQAEVEKRTEGELFDAVVDTTAAKVSMENAWRWVGQGGRVLFVGICGGTLEIDGLAFHMKEPSLFVTRNSTRQDFERVLAYWRMGALEPGRFVTHTVPFDRAADEVVRWTDPAAGVFKGVIRF